MNYLEEIRKDNQQKRDKAMTEFSKGYPTKSWKSLYLPCLNKFFNFIDSIGSVFNKIDSQEINAFLDSLTGASEKMNCYRALAPFYKFTYASDITKEVLKGVVKPPAPQRKTTYLPNEHIQLIIKYIENDSNKLGDRLLLAFFLYTGLKRRFIFNMRNWHIWPMDSKKPYLWIMEKNDEDIQLPLCPELLKILALYTKKRGEFNPSDKVFNYSGDSSISDRVAELSMKITGVGYSPRMYSDTFIKHALAVGNDVHTVSALTLISVAVISKHLQINNGLTPKQEHVLNEIYKDLQ